MTVQWTVRSVGRPSPQARPIPVAGAKKGIAIFVAMLFYATVNRAHFQSFALNWVRISDQDRCQLASIRSGRNSSRSEPSRFLTGGASLSPTLLGSHFYQRRRVAC